MIKEGSWTFVDDGRPVTPFVGKYAAKVPNIFELIREGWGRAGVAEAPYRPLRIEFELTTKCNDTCPSCGMGALSMKDGRTLTASEIERLAEEFASIALPGVAITGGEPFAARPAMRRFMRAVRGRVDISKLTTNGYWGGSDLQVGRVFEALVKDGLLENRLFVPLMMLSIGEQTTPLPSVCRIIHHVVTEFTDHDLNLAISSLADPADRAHKIYPLMAQYEAMYGPFPHGRIHSTMRVYLENERLEQQAEINRPGETPVSKWMDRCFDCFAPTVGAYVLPTALLKQHGDLYACAAFNVPEKLSFGNLFTEPLREIVNRTNRSGYVRTVREGHGLAGLHSVIPRQVTDEMRSGSFCDSCTLLIDKYEEHTGDLMPPKSVIPTDSLFSRIGGQRDV